jgi:FAD/FMN-containing dehydrogenase
VDRRSFVRVGLGTTAGVTLSACTGAKATPQVPTVRRRSLPGAAPPRSAWSALEQGLDGGLLRPGEAGFRAAGRLYDPRFDGASPAAVVQALTTQDVVETLRFARRHRLPLRARSGGHSYVGESTVTGGIQLDLRRMDRVGFDPSSLTVRVGAGAALFRVHEALDPRGRTVPTGTCPTVGAAGLTLGGGIGVESRAFGLTCDNVLELTVVTADGVVRRVDGERHADLFWASRGGGGGSFGVVTSMRLATRPAGELGFFFLRYAASDAEAMVQGWQRRVAAMPDSCWANVHLDAHPAGPDARIVGVTLAGDADLQAEAMQAAIGRDAPQVTTFVRSHHDGVRLLAGCSTLPDAQCGPAPDGGLGREGFVAGSDVVARPLTSSEVAAALAHVRALGSAGRTGTLLLDPLGGRVAAVRRGGSAFPWRGATAVAQWYVPVADHPSREAVRAAYAWVRGGHRAVGGASAGGYVNYLEPGRPPRDYFGANLPRLRRVKAAYDPDDFFHTPSSIRLP